jgi:hypothetical protein
MERTPDPPCFKVAAANISGATFMMTAWLAAFQWRAVELPLQLVLRAKFDLDRDGGQAQICSNALVRGLSSRRRRAKLLKHFVGQSPRQQPA